MNLEVKFQEMEEMINSFPPDLKLIKEALTNKLKEVKQEVEFNYLPAWRSVSWSVADFEGRAIQRKGENWKKFYDKFKFEDTLARMIAKHDATIGITWETIDFYLDEFCSKETW